MKIRSGFVSNSSSSSFIIAFKGDKKQLKSRLTTIFKLPDDYPLHQLVDGISETIFKCIEEGYRAGITGTKEYLAYIEDEGNDPDDDQIALIDKGFTLYPGSFSSEEYGIEETLCETDIDYVSDDLIIKHEGGY